MLAAVRVTVEVGGSPVDEQTIDASVAFGATMPLTDTGPLAKSPSVTLPRSTVLPRIEMVGTEPRLVLGTQRRYETVRRLGEGGFGEVLGARDDDIGREVAVKRLHPEMRSPGVLARFAEEVRTIGSLEHPNIVPIHDVGVEENGDYYFVMKYVAGDTLESIIDKLAAGDASTHARFGVERRVQIFLALLEAVAFAHSKGILHRDIKPANVMVGAYGEVVLMDWGIAKRLRDPGLAPEEISPEPSPISKNSDAGGSRGALYQTRNGELVGTPAYMSPEQSRGEPIDERSDVYALSLLFYELLTLKHPLAEKTTLPDMLRAISHESPPLAGMLNHPHQPSTSMDLSWFLRKGLAKDPAERYATVSEMITRLERRAEGIIPVQCPITFMKQTSNRLGRFIDRRPLLATFLMFASVVAVIAEGVRAVH
jgi:eukaryotic-like serine/threonine-protein kinase